jgi:signal transduction histidine kinase
MEVHPVTFDMAHLISYCVAAVGPLVKEGVTLNSQVEEVDEAFTDEARLRQMIINLLSNAIKFTDTGEVELRLQCYRLPSEVANKQASPVELQVKDESEAEIGEEMMAISVSDTGRGIPADELPFIFDEYHQVKGVESSIQKGTGLGLSIAQKCAELLGGTIEVKSELGMGSVFTLRIPMIYKG